MAVRMKEAGSKISLRDLSACSKVRKGRETECHSRLIFVNLLVFSCRK